MMITENDIIFDHLYEELMWDHEVALEFKADYKNNRIIIKPYECE